MLASCNKHIGLKFKTLTVLVYKLTQKLGTKILIIINYLKILYKAKYTRGTRSRLHTLHDLFNRLYLLIFMQSLFTEKDMTSLMRAHRKSVTNGVGVFCCKQLQ